MALEIAPSNGKTVLITGINGYIASVLGRHLLEKGYSIRGTARRSATTEPLLKGPYALYKDRVEIVEVAVMTISGAFDQSVKGVHGIFHTASPVDFSLTKYEQVVLQAEKGAEGILKSALAAGPQLHSVVVTSSTISITDPKQEVGHTFTEADFATSAWEYAKKNEEERKATPSGILYAASKTASERAVWTFRNTHKPKFAITTIHPTVVMGPPIILPPPGTPLNETLRPILSLFAGASATVPLSIGSSGYVDVRDVALIHTWAFEHPSTAGGERYIATSGFLPMQAAADMLRQVYEGTDLKNRIAVGIPGQGYVGYNKETAKVESVDHLEGGYRLSAAKIEKAMGLSFRGFKEVLIDTVEAIKPLIQTTK